MSQSYRTTDARHQLQGITVAVRGNAVAVVALSAAGLPVEKHVATTQATWREIVGIISKAALALEHVHTLADSRLHGTLQSTDIVIQDNGGCVVCNFRTARKETPSSCTAPEQLSARPSDQRTDIYRLGVVFYKLLTRREPFRASDPELLCEQIRDDAPQPPRQLVHGLPQELDSICLRMLAKAPVDRIASGRQVAEDLQGVLRQFEDQSERRMQSSAGTQAARYDLVIIHLETADGLDLATSVDMQKLLVEHHATPVSWDGDEILLHLTQTVSHDDAISRVVTIGACLLDVVFRWAQQSSQRYRVRIESAELDVSDSQLVSATDRCRSSDLIRRVPRVVGEVARERVQVDHASWQSLRRWVKHAESNGVAEVQASADRGLLRVHIQPAEPTGDPVGPASPLAIAKARWAQAKEGLGQMLLIIGEEGTGKSRLVAEVVRLVEQSEQPEVVVWNCIPCQQGSSFHPLARALKQQLSRLQTHADDQRVEVVKQYLSDVGETCEESAECLMSVLEAEESAHSDAMRPLSLTHKEGVHDLMLKWLGNTTKQSPVLFIVEDLQWADAATLDLITRLAADRLYEHLLLIATFRPEFETLWGSRAHQTQVAIRRLSAKHVKSMMSLRLGDGLVDEHVIEQAVRATGGVPMYIEAYLNRLH